MNLSSNDFSSNDKLDKDSGAFQIISEVSQCNSSGMEFMHNVNRFEFWNNFNKHNSRNQTCCNSERHGTSDFSKILFWAALNYSPSRK